MPFIETKTSAAATPKQKEQLFQKLGKAIEIIPGKSEQWLMLNLQSEQELCFQGDASKPAALVDVRIFGEAAHEAYEQLTAAICDILEEVFGIPADRVYVCYKGYDEWGWNRMNF